MKEDADKLLYVIAYAGTDAGRKALGDYLAEVARLRVVAEAARGLTRWDWLRLLSDPGGDADEAVRDVKAVERALAELDGDT